MEETKEDLSGKGKGNFLGKGNILPLALVTQYYQVPKLSELNT